MTPLTPSASDAPLPGAEGHHVGDAAADTGEAAKGSAASPAPRVIGIDLSLTGTGIASVVPGAPSYVTTVASVAPKTPRDPKTGKPKPPTVAQRRQRLHALRDRVNQFCLLADLVVIEAPAFSRTTGHMHDRSGLWWLVVTALSDFPVVEVTATGRAKYATGKGNAGKDAVLAAVVRRYPDVDVQDNNQADALVLAAMGARWLGHPIDQLPLTHLAAMDAVAWPEQVSA